MGLFDIGIRKELSTQKSKDEILDILKQKFTKIDDNTAIIENKTLILNDFRTSILKYDLSIKLDETKDGFKLAIDGELQQFYVLILVVLIILSIIITYGIGVAVVVGFAYLQKHFASKFVDSLVENIS